LVLKSFSVAQYLKNFGNEDWKMKKSLKKGTHLQSDSKSTIFVKI